MKQINIVVLNYAPPPLYFLVSSTPLLIDNLANT